MKINKAHFETDGVDIRLSMPFAKVNKEHRTVEGFATLDNVDEQDDIITANASKNAFAKWRGNIREMHGKNAVGKLLSMKEDTYYDEATDTTYNGVWVRVYVSKGAQDTWEKVLDGTLTGFSLGGSVNKSDDMYHDLKKKKVRVIEDYTLSELSLVDNPCNQLANILSFQKNIDGTTDVSGIVSETEIENIFYCTTDKIALTSQDDSRDCVSCGKVMKNIGWVEDASNKDDVVRKAIAKFNKPLPVIYTTGNTTTTGTNYTVNFSGNVDPEAISKIVIANLTKGGVDVSKEEEGKVGGGDQPVAGTAATNVETPEVAAAPEAEATNVEEVETPDLQKMFAGLQDSIMEALKTSKTETEEKIEEMSKSFDSKVSDLAGKFAEIEKTVGGLKGTTDDVEKRLGSVEKGTALRKSADLGGDAGGKEVKTGVWRGAFLGVTNVTE